MGRLRVSLGHLLVHIVLWEVSERRVSVFGAVLRLPRSVVHVLGLGKHRPEVVLVDDVRGDLLFSEAGVGLDFGEHGDLFFSA